MTDASPNLGQRTRLPARVVRYWRVKAAMAVATAVIVVAVVAVVSGDSFPVAIPVVAAVVVLSLAIAEFAAIPIRYRTWWFAIGDEQIDLERGVVFRAHTVIPMTRVQHVELQRGPLAGRFTLAELEIHTAAGSVKIPALDRADGERIRQRIAELARIADDL